ncbi:caspase domain-containing protein [Lactarius psammicola]|nr:caspase domain-containing protein [Lactarius psammicola]
MGNFVSSSCSASSRPTTTPSPSQLPTSPPSPSLPSHRKDRCALTSALATHATRLANLFRWSSVPGGRIRLDDIEEGHSLPTDDAMTRGPHAAADMPNNGRRRALLIGIAYHGELLNTHKDVDRYRDVLLGTSERLSSLFLFNFPHLFYCLSLFYCLIIVIRYPYCIYPLILDDTGTYGYSAEDVVVLKDDPALPDYLQPTRENILRELRHLVADAASGDRFTFLYSGHSNQQRSKDLNEEDFQDEYLITIDDDIVVDNELNDILVKPLPAGSSLFALLDTCHSGTLLDLPHYHCNSVYVPWRSKGKRRTNSWQNVTVIQDPLFSEAATTAPPRSSIANILAWGKPSAPTTTNARSVLPIFVSIPLSIDQRVAPAPIEVGARHLREYDLPSSPRLCASPVSRFPCDGWCRTDPESQTATVVSLAACSDYQRTWEAYDSSLTRIVCGFLEQNKRPSYKELMMHINYKLHATSRQLHEWTRSEKTKLKNARSPEASATGAVVTRVCDDEKQAPVPNCTEKKPSSADAESLSSFDGEMDNFQTPLLSSLVPLNMRDVLRV